MPALLETVALTRDILELGLLRGDVGAVVEICPPDAFEVEFVVASGRTRALATLTAADIRPLGEHDFLAVRSLVGADAA